MTTTPDADPFTDERLTADLTDSMPGPARRAEHLLKVPHAVRAEISAEAHTMLNLTRGWRPSDALSHIVDGYLRTGQVPTRYRDDADRLRREEQARRDDRTRALAAAMGIVPSAGDETNP